MQCVQIKAMEPKSEEANPQQRFRVVLSDIRNFIQTMLATREVNFPGETTLLMFAAANDVVISGKLKKGAIIRLIKYNPQQVKDKKCVCPLLVDTVLTTLENLDPHGNRRARPVW